eukprot:gene17692-7796_t
MNPNGDLNVTNTPGLYHFWSWVDGEHRGDAFCSGHPLAAELAAMDAEERERARRHARALSSGHHCRHSYDASCSYLTLDDFAVVPGAAFRPPLLRGGRLGEVGEARMRDIGLADAEIRKLRGA